MESFFTCALFCPTYGEVTLQCQNITFMNWLLICVLCTDCILMLAVALSS